MKKCFSCGKLNDQEALFCDSCGARLSPEEKILQIISIGKALDNDKVINNPYVSRKHALLKIYSNKIVIEDLNSTNGTYVNGTRITIAEVKPTDEVEFSKEYKTTIANIINETKGIKRETKEFNKEAGVNKPDEVLFIGRLPENDIVINNVKVSRRHAKLERYGDKWHIEDLGSLNGTFVNSVKIKRAFVTSKDLITIGGIPIYLDELLSPKKGKEIKGEVKLTTKNLTFRVKEKVIVDNISLTIFPGEFVGLIGPSGAGKTSLMLMMNGVVKPSSGDVFINSQSLFENYSSFKGQIGYVPQDDIIHRELKVKESLLYNGRLRLENYSEGDIETRVEEVITSLGLKEAKNTLIGSPEKKGISGGQRKRVNLGQELLTEPSILFLDEPTSGLDPKTDMDVMKLLRGIADKGKIVVLTTHSITEENFNILTHLVVLTKGGKLAYFGPANEAVKYFGVGKPYEIFDKLNQKDPSYWQELYKKSRYYKEFVSDRESEEIKLSQSRNKYDLSRRKINLKQFFILASRYLKIKTRDVVGAMILLLQAPLIAALIALVFSKEEEKTQALFLLVIAAIWFGCSNAAREIVSEQSIYKRERMVFLKIPSYIFSKVSILLILCIIQSAILTGVTISSLDFNAGFIDMFFLLLTASLAALLIGLFVSSLVSTNEAAMALMPIILIPQVILGGLISKFSDMSDFVKSLSGCMLSRWSFEAALILEYEKNHSEIIHGIGFDTDNLNNDYYMLGFFALLFFFLIAFSLKRKDK